MREFTLAQANALVPRVKPLLVALRDAFHAFTFAREQHQDAVAAGDEPEALRWQADAERRGAEVASIVDEIVAFGCDVKDPTMGLIDFPARRDDGTLVLLCLRDDEPEIGHWHPLDTGFAGRRPMSEF